MGVLMSTHQVMAKEGFFPLHFYPSLDQCPRDVRFCLMGPLQNSGGCSLDFFSLLPFQGWLAYLPSWQQFSYMLYRQTRVCGTKGTDATALGTLSRRAKWV